MVGRDRFRSHGNALVRRVGPMAAVGEHRSVTDDTRASDNQPAPEISRRTDSAGHLRVWCARPHRGRTATGPDDRRRCGQPGRRVGIPELSQLRREANRCGRVRANRSIALSHLSREVALVRPQHAVGRVGDDRMPEPVERPDDLRAAGDGHFPLFSCAPPNRTATLICYLLSVIGYCDWSLAIG